MTHKEIESFIARRIEEHLAKGGKLQAGTMGLEFRDNTFVISNPCRGCCAIGAMLAGTPSFIGDTFARAGAILGVDSVSVLNIAVGFDTPTRNLPESTNKPFLEIGQRLRATYLPI
jgi:hypothetical protein